MQKPPGMGGLRIGFNLWLLILGLGFRVSGLDPLFGGTQAKVHATCGL